MRSFARFAACAVLVATTYARAAKHEFSWEAADAYVDLMTFIVSQVEGAELKLNSQQKKDLVADIRAHWDDGDEGWQLRVLDSSRQYPELLRVWKIADESIRQRCVASWKRQLQKAKTAASHDNLWWQAAALRAPAKQTKP